MRHVQQQAVKSSPIGLAGDWQVRAAVAAVCVTLAGVPLIITPGLAQQYETTPKLALLLVSTAVLLSCSSAWWPGVASLLGNRQGRIFASLLASQIALLAVSTALSPRPSLTFGGSSWRRYGLVTPFAVAVFCWLCAALAAAHPWCLRRLLRVAVLASGAIALDGISQVGEFDRLLDSKLYTTIYHGDMLRIPSTVGAAVYLGSFLAASIPLALGLVGEARGATRRVLEAIALLALAG